MRMESVSNGRENVKIYGRVNAGRGILAKWLSELLRKRHNFCYTHTECWIIILAYSSNELK